MTADLLIYNADVVTMDPLLPRATALAIREGRVIALGEEADLRLRFAGAARQIDAGGRQILPGLQDLHIHLQDSGYYTGTMADLYACRSEADLTRALGDFAASHDRDWVFGVGFACGHFSNANLGRAVLDRMVPDRPVLIYGSDLHSACLNSRGCELLGLTAETPDPYNGHFTRRPDGTPTGMLHEQAMYWARDRIGEIPDSAYRFGVQHGQALCHSLGITGIIDPMVQPRHARVYQSMAEDGTLKLRVGGAIHITADEALPEAMARALRMRAAHDHPLFRLHSVKFFIDGVLENRTAAMLEDYADADGGNAPLMFPPEQLNALCIAFDAARFQLHMHVIGDAAVRAGLDGLEAAVRENGRWPALHQMTHLECVRPEDICRLGQLGGVANIQALWARREPSVTEVA
ncbi:amidohydrolase family protein, partial [Pseudooceanicola sp. GBMRC 2024]